MPYPDLAKFLPSGYYISDASFTHLTTSGPPQFVVSASGPPPKALAAQDQGWYTTTLLVLAWGSRVHAWHVAFNATAQPGYKAYSNAGATGPGLVLAGHKGPSFALLHDEPGGASDLEYWLDTAEATARSSSSVSCITPTRKRAWLGPQLNGLLTHSWHRPAYRLLVRPLASGCG